MLCSKDLAMNKADIVPAFVAPLLLLLDRVFSRSDTAGKEKNKSIGKVCNRQA